ncbi:MAG: hypothetical protein MUC48_27670 [Leptolyngbya sp. Prado105]|nr:hypothetical protein [Leptolyngbya sp. Prado105]
MIITVNDSGSWIKGDNTLAKLGLNLVTIPYGTEALGSDLAKLSSPLGEIEFASKVNKRQIGNGWRSWSHDYRGAVYFTNASTTLDLKLPNLIAFDFYAQPDVFLPFKLSAIAQSGTISEVLTQTVDGDSGAKYYGFYSDDPSDPIQAIRITADEGSKGFAIGQMRGAATTIPSPALVPGMIAFSIGLWRKYRARTNWE